MTYRRDSPSCCMFSDRSICCHPLSPSNSANRASPNKQYFLSFCQFSIIAHILTPLEDWKFVIILGDFHRGKVVAFVCELGRCGLFFLPKKGTLGSSKSRNKGERKTFNCLSSVPHKDNYLMCLLLLLRWPVVVVESTKKAFVHDSEFQLTNYPSRPLQTP
jgi:hypothetical protein